MPLIDTLNVWADRWATFMWGSLLDTTALLTVVSIVWLTVRRWAPAQLGYCLFLLVIIKPCLPGHISVSGTAAYLSPSYVVEQLEAWASLDMRGNVAGQQLGPPATHDSLMEEIVAMKANTPAREVANGASSSQLSVAGKLMCAWAAVVLALLGWFVWSQIKLRQILRGATPVSGDSLEVNVSELARASHVDRPVRVMTSQAVNSPAIAGLFGTCIVLPSGLSKQLSVPQLRWVLLHELAHIRRYDLWVAVFQRLVQIAHFWNPAVWLANRIIDQQREYACDDTAMIGSTTSRRECGAAFLSVLERASAQPRWMIPALGFFSAKHCFRSRLMRILDSNRTVRTRLSVGAMAILLMLTVLLLPRLQAAPQDAVENAADTQPSQEAVDADAVESSTSDDEESGNEPELTGQADDAQDNVSNSDAEKRLEKLGARIGREDRAVIHVRLADCHPTPDDLALLAKLDWSTTKKSGFPGKPYVFLANTHLGDDHLKQLAKLTDLTSLFIYGEQDFTAKGLESIKTLTNLSGLYLTDSGITDDGLLQIKDLTNLKGLYLMNNPKVSDAGLEHLKGLTKVRNLWLNGTSVTDAGLEHLAGMKDLWTLHLGRTKVTDAGLERLKQLLPNITGGLHLTGTNVTDAGLVHLTGRRDLKYLRLGRTKVTDAGLEHLRQLPDLQRLWLWETSITNDGLRHVAGLTELDWLDLSGTRITDAGLDDLVKLKKLATLNLKETKVSTAGVARLQKSLPECKIEFN